MRIHTDCVSIQDTQIALRNIAGSCEGLTISIMLLYPPLRSAKHPGSSVVFMPHPGAGTDIIFLGTSSFGGMTNPLYETRNRMMSTAQTMAIEATSTEYLWNGTAPYSDL